MKVNITKIYKEYIKNFPVKDLIPYKKNPRINDKSVKEVIKSINKNGNLDPIEIDEQNIILCGHTRKKALEKLGIEFTDVVKYSGLLNKQKKDYRIRNNKTPEFSKWNFDLLKEEFQMEELVDFGFNLQELNLNNINYKDLSDKYKESYEVVCECENEKEQESLFLKLSSEGIKCRLLIL
jgi:hypothetical protein